MGTHAEGRRRGSNAPGAKPPAAGELAQIERRDHVEGGARADREFGGGHGGGHEGFRHDQIRQRRQARIPPLAAAAPLQARPSDGEAIVLGEPPVARVLQGGEMGAKARLALLVAADVPGNGAQAEIDAGKMRPRLAAAAQQIGDEQRAEPKIMFGRGQFLPGLISDGRGEGGRQRRGRFDPRAPLRKKRLFVVIGIVDQRMAGLVGVGRPLNRRRGVGAGGEQPRGARDHGVDRQKFRGCRADVNREKSAIWRPQLTFI